jgi:hypothetical protein
MYGDTITFVATVTSGSGTPTGTVTFQVRDGAVLATVPLSSGSATYTTSSLPVGMMIVEAGYNGDTDFDPAFCGAGDIWISRAVSYSGICSLSGDTWGDSSVYGEPVSIIAHVAPYSRGTPTGTMTFYDGTDSLGTVALSSVSPDSAFGIFTTSSLSTGTHSITAEYSGDTYFIVSTSDLFIQTVYQAESTTSVSSSGNPSVAGQPVTFTATVTPVSPGAGTPTGTVTFYDDTASLGTGTLSSREATFSTSSLSTGTHSITAVYDGDTNFTGSTSSILSQVVQSESTTSISSSANPSAAGQSVTLTATVTPVSPGVGTPTGTVTFYDGTALLGTGTLSSGSATVTTSSLSVGSHSITAGYSGDADFTGSSSVAITQTVNQASGTTSVTSSVNPSVYGQSVTFTATVTPVSPGAGTPTGTVTFYDGTASLGTGTLSSGDATLSTSSLSTGTHSVTAVYGGDTDFTGSSSIAITQTVNQASGTTSVSSSVNPSVAGQPVTFTATVTPVLPGAGTPTGTVTFYDGTASLGTGTLSSGSATFSTSSLSVGSHSITAVYSGDSDFTGSSSVAITQTVSQASGTTSVSSSVNPSVAGQSVTFTATVTPVSPGAGIPTGTVTFYDGTASLGTGTLSSGSATFSTSSLNVGSHSITAVYGGDTGFTGSTSDAMTQTVSQASGTTSISSSVNPSVYGQSVTFTATVTPVSPGAGIPTGTVTFYDGTASLGTGTLSSGSATFSTSSLSTGTHSITAAYSGDSDFTVSTSSILNQVVQAESTTSVGSSVNPSAAGQSVTFTATVTPVSPGAGIPTGTVTFYDGTASLGTGTLSSGSATFSTSSLSVGTHSITAVYGGDTDFTGSTSDAMTQMVSQASGTTSISSSVNPSVYGQSVTFTATETPVSPSAGTPTGTVTFYDGTASLGTGTLSSGSATFSTSSLSVGTHSITAVYGGDTDFTGSTSNAITQTVSQAGMTIPAASASAVTMPDTSENTDDFPSSAIPPMTITVNIGGDSKAWQAVVTGTKLSELIVTGTVEHGNGDNQTAPPGTVFQYISLVPARFTGITKAVIHFTVPQSWLDENHIDPKNIVLYHQTANGWEALPTTMLSTKDGTVYFSMESTGFSLFAIAGTPTVLTPPVAAATQEIVNTPVQEQTTVPAAVTNAPATTQTTAPPATSPQPAAPSPLLNIVLVIAAIGILAGGGFMVRRWWIRRQNPALFEEY